MSPLLIRGGTVIDSTGSRDEDIAVVDNIIVPIDTVPSSATVIDASGCVVSTGLVDLHTHLGEPGDEAAETMVTGGRAAVLGGFTTVLAMPNTMPPVDTAAVVEHIRTLAKAALCRVEIAGCVTVGAAGTHLAPLGELADAGVRFVTDCGVGVPSPLLNPLTVSSSASVPKCTKANGRAAWVCPAHRLKPRRSWSCATSLWLGLRGLGFISKHFRQPVRSPLSAPPNVPGSV
jgi:dihydroorotase-like cyclic amidohydrolase